MLLAVEGGFFSSSASGYSKGLIHLLLGQENAEKPMRVAPWNLYQFVDQETDPNIQLASTKNRIIRGCASFVCFGCAAAGFESPSLKVGSTEVTVPDKNKDQICATDHVGCETSVTKIDTRSSLRKPKNGIPGSGVDVNEHELLCEKYGNNVAQTEERKVQWTDATGGELFEIREFEPSDDGHSDDKFGNASGGACSCGIM